MCINKKKGRYCYKKILFYKGRIFRLYPKDYNLMVFTKNPKNSVVSNVNTFTVIIRRQIQRSYTIYV